MVITLYYLDSIGGDGHVKRVLHYKVLVNDSINLYLTQ